MLQQQLNWPPVRYNCSSARRTSTFEQKKAPVGIKCIQSESTTTNTHSQNIYKMSWGKKIQMFFLYPKIHIILYASVYGRYKMLARVGVGLALSSRHTCVWGPPCVRCMCTRHACGYLFCRSRLHRIPYPAVCMNYILVRNFFFCSIFEDWAK